ncbi:MAG: histidine--tRNA ligase [Alphaproteobacteria bacterium]|nr:histidine--tRNA ligase [Alphaproteobacteria bacterium]
MPPVPELLSPRLPRGFADRRGADLHLVRGMIEKIRAVYERYGFEQLETPCIEFADAVGKFLPDQDRPNEGVFALQDDDEQWLCLRYDLTAPLARFVAENFETLPLPFRRYQIGQVFRNEKPGAGRYREFTQFDADAVGTASMAADAEFCMLVADAMEAVGLSRGDYIVKVNNRKVLNGILEMIGVPMGSEGEAARGAVLRAMDKLDRLGTDGVRLLLGKGRKDPSGDFTAGAGLDDASVERVLAFLSAGSDGSRESVCQTLEKLVGTSEAGLEGVAELRAIDATLAASGFGDDRVRFDPSVVRGLAYYTGPVYETELTFEVKDENGQPVRFGSVGGGGRYDDLVERFKGTKVPATGVSIGVSRLAAALSMKGLLGAGTAPKLVIVTVMDAEGQVTAQKMVRELRDAGIASEVYLGSGRLGAQLKYADKRGAAVAIIEGGDERAKGVVKLKDLVRGAQRAKDAATREEWRAKSGDTEFDVSRSELVAGVRRILDRTD